MPLKVLMFLSKASSALFKAMRDVTDIFFFDVVPLEEPLSYNMKNIKSSHDLVVKTQQNMKIYKYASVHGDKCKKTQVLLLQQCETYYVFDY